MSNPMRGRRGRDSSGSAAAAGISVVGMVADIEPWGGGHPGVGEEEMIAAPAAPPTTPDVFLALHGRSQSPLATAPPLHAKDFAGMADDILADEQTPAAPRTAALGRVMPTVNPLFDAHNAFAPGTSNPSAMRKRHQQQSHPQTPLPEGLHVKRMLPPSTTEEPVPLRPSFSGPLAGGSAGGSGSAQEALCVVLTLPEPKQEGFCRPANRQPRGGASSPTKIAPVSAGAGGYGRGYSSGMGTASSGPLQPGMFTGVPGDAAFLHAMGGGALGAHAPLCGTQPLAACSSAPPGRVPRLSFGDSRHHVDAPRSPIKGKPPLITPSSHAGQACAYGHWGEFVDDPSQLFAASPVPQKPPLPPGADCLPTTSMLQPPALPESPSDPALAAATRPFRYAGTSRESRRPFTPNTPGLPPAPTEAYDPRALSRPRSEMALKPLRSVGRFSTAVDPSKLSAWQYQTLQRTKPTAHITKRAANFQPTANALLRSSSAGALGDPSASAASFAATFDSLAPAPATRQPPGTPAEMDPAARADQQLADQLAAMRGRVDAEGMRHVVAASREEAAAFIAEAEHFIEFAEQALVHASPSGGRRGMGADATSKRGSKKLGTLPERAKKEAQPLSRQPSRAGGPRGYEPPADETEGFPRQLLDALQGVPGVPLQMLRLMKRGDWRVRG